VSRLRLWIPAIAYMALIFVVSSMRIQAPILESFPLRDKGVHFLEYAVLGFLCAHATLATWPRRPRLRVLLVAVLIAAAWGLSDELHQALVPGRSAEVLDFVADAVGASVGVLVRAKLGSIKEKKWGESSSRTAA